MAHEWMLNSGEFMNSYREVEGKYLDLLLANNEKDKKPLWAVGPLHMLLESHESSDRNRHECLEFLDKQDANSINELALGLDQSKHRFIWVLREADKKMGVEKFEAKERNKIKLPEGFEERVEGRGMVVRNWVPKLEILGHPSTGGFLSDCGWNSCLESISMGVPIAAWPNNADQPYNAVFVTSVLKIGISVWSWARTRDL
ncbi:PREDICTED: zeatin O-glucosyltransferase-like [Nicotiana attenuata]|uniref:zeatin O-glucosyltransferase-like n=1 Tax=Nicotiana attenuata TaxID=49451 RepID=UPI000905C615|nr:PREDICTED: zeatin O-glucosyltransferase-like [Nicotiana attenuata]